MLVDKNYKVLDRFVCDDFTFIVDMINKYLRDKQIKACLITYTNTLNILHYYCEIRKYVEEVY